MRRSVILSLGMLAAGLAGCAPTVPEDDPPKKDRPRATCDGEATRTPLRLLTRAEYDATVFDVLGVGSNPSKDFPREPLSHGWDNDGTLNQVTDESLARYLEAAETVAAAVVGTPALPACPAHDVSCGPPLITTVGRRLFRRPLTDAERNGFLALFNATVQMADVDTATEWTLAAMLQSPQFLYRVEEGVAVAEDSKAWRTPLDDYELATRLSYLLWASAPDDALLDAASAGTLADPQTLEAQARRALADPKSHRGKRRFFDLWLRLDDIGQLDKATAVYPAFSGQLPSAWRSSLDLFIDDVLAGSGTLSTLLTSNALYVNDTMAMYAEGGSAGSFVKVTMPPAQRTGLLTQPGFLARLSSPDQSSPIRRGIFVLEKLMCQPPSPPPPGVNAVPPALNTGRTTRERFAQHTQSDDCRGCHAMIDPVGFGFERYDALGAWRDTDNGYPVDDRGEIVVATDPTVLGPFEGAAELAGRLAASPQVHDCVASEWLRFAMGRALGPGDACSVKQVQQGFTASGGKFDDLLVSIVMSDTFRTRPVTP